MKKYVQSFIEGQVHPRDFMAELENNAEVYDWLQSIVPEGKTFHKCEILVNDIGQNAHTIVLALYDVRLSIATLKELCRGQTWCTYYYVHREICDLWKAAFPDEKIAISELIKNRFYFELEAVPRYIGGKEIYELGILDDIIDAVPSELSHEERAEACRNLVLDKFQVDERNHPHWRREAQWPLGVNRQPMRFLWQRQVDDLHEYDFEDVETGELKTVCQ